MVSSDDLKHAEAFLRQHPRLVAMINDPEQRDVLRLLSGQEFSRLAYLAQNPWLDFERIVDIADSIMNISPDISGDDLLNTLCRDAVLLTEAQAATCRTHDPVKNSMVASGSCNWNVERTESIPYEDSIAGRVIRDQTHLCVADISTEPLYREKEKSVAMGINSMLAVPIQLIDYEGAEKKDVLLGTLQIYFQERNKTFYPEQIKLIKSIVRRFSYVLAQQRKLALQKKSTIIRESRRALTAIMKRTQSLDQVLSFLVAKIAETIKVNRCSLFSIEQDPGGGQVAVLVAGYPLASLEHRYGITLPFDQHPAFREVCGSGRPLLIEDARHDPRMQASSELYLHKKIENVYFFPLKDETDTVSTVLVLDGDESRPLDNDDLVFCSSLIQDIELCIQVSLRSQERHDFYNQMLSFAAIARVYTRKLAAADTPRQELDRLYRKLYTSMLAVDDIITDRIPFAQKEPFDLNEVMKERLDAYYFPAGVTIEQNIEGIALPVTADRKKVGRIVGNLLDNAHKKLEELQSGCLRVCSCVRDGYAVIEIGNSGAMPREVERTLLQGQRLQPPQASDVGGQGLAIVQLFTLMHNGMVEYESTPERDWTLFRVRLPQEAEQAQHT